MHSRDTVTPDTCDGQMPWRVRALRQSPDRLRYRSMLDAAVLVLNRSFLPIHVTSVRRAFILLYQGLARAVDERYDTFDFEGWRKLIVRGGDHSVGTVGGRIRVPRVVQLAVFDRV